VALEFDLYPLALYPTPYTLYLISYTLHWFIVKEISLFLFVGAAFSRD
jgi:hypothetical protein